MLLEMGTLSMIQENAGAFFCFLLIIFSKMCLKIHNARMNLIVLLA